MLTPMSLTSNKLIFLSCILILSFISFPAYADTGGTDMFSITVDWNDDVETTSTAFMGNIFFSNHEKGIVNKVELNKEGGCKSKECKKVLQNLRIKYKKNENGEIFNITKLNTSSKKISKKAAFFISTVGSGSVGRFFNHGPVVSFKNKITGETKKFALSKLGEKRSAKYWHVFNLDLIQNKAIPIKKCCKKKQLNYSLGNGRLVSGFASIRKSIFFSNTTSSPKIKDTKNINTSSSKKTNDQFLGQSYLYKILDIFSGDGDLFINVDKKSDIQATKSNYKKTDKEYDVGDNFISNWGKALGDLLQ